MITALRSSKIRKAEAASHKAVYRLQVMPAREHGHWYDLPVVNYSVTMNERGVPGAQRTLNAVVALSHATQANVSKVDVLGSWIKAFIDVEAVYPERGFKFTVPLGVFQVQTMTVGVTTGEVTIEAADAGRVIEAHAAITLADRTRAKGASRLTWLNKIISDCWPAGMPKSYLGTTGLLDTAAVADTTISVPIWSPEGDRAGVVNSIVSTMRARGNARVYLVPDLDGSHVYTLVAQDTTPVATISPMANLTGSQYIEDRSDLINSVHVVWTGQVAGSAVGVTQQQRNVVSLADGELRVTGAFGIQSAEVAASDKVTSVASAQTEGVATMQRIAQSWAHDLPVTTSPIYGIQAGDWVTVDGYGKAEVVGGVISSNGDWALNLRKYESVSSARPSILYGKVQREAARTDDAVWNEISVPLTLAANFGTNVGWTLTGGRWFSTGSPAKVQPGQFEATATRARLTSVDVLPVPSTRRVRVTFRISASKVTSTANAKGKGLSAKAAIVYNGRAYWNMQQLNLTDPPDDLNPSVSKRGEGIEVTADMQLPAGTPTTFGVMLECFGLGTNQYVEVSEARVEAGSRPRT